MKRHYFPDKVSHPFRHNRHSLSHGAILPVLAGHRVLSFSAVSLIGVFMPIFWYELFGTSITFVLLFYFINFLFKLPFFVVGAKIFSKIGLVPSMIIGVFGYVGFFISVYLINNSGLLNQNLLIGATIFFLMLVSVLYWSPINIDMADFTKKEKRGDQIGKFYSVQILVSILAPILGGFLITKHGYDISFGVGIFLMFTSIVPLLFLPKHKVKFEFGFIETFKKVYSKQYRSMTISMMAYGAEGVVGVTVWPIFLYIVFSGNYFNVGGFTSIIVLISLALQLFIGRKTDRVSKKKLIRIGSGVYALGWVFKGLVETVAGVFAASTFHSLGSIILRTPIDVLSYDQAADSGHYIDEYTLLREISLTIGRASMLLLLIFVTYYHSIGVSFIIAAVVSLGVNQLVNYHAEQ